MLLSRTCLSNLLIQKCFVEIKEKPARLEQLYHPRSCQ